MDATTMSKREREELYCRQCWRLPEDIPFCINCAHFHRHYVVGGPPVFKVSMVPLDCGHCAFPRMKERKAYDTCGRFQNKNIVTAGA